MAPRHRIKLKRAYDAPTRSDGKRILVDRLWPRGLRKEDANLHSWVKDIAPSNELRKWFGHDPDRWHTFQERYKTELAENGDEIRELRALANSGTITLVYGARDEEHNNAVVLRQVLETE
tara:strand:- start:4408 stop:4767 length:360 start_codon:yes stop_codon:yes gene_type:complete